MGELFSANKTYIFIALGVIAALVAWWTLSGDTRSNSLLVGQDAAQQAALVEGGAENIVDTLLQLRAVTLSGTIFSDPTFGRLQDFGTQIVPEPVGRPNPFIPYTASATTTVGTDSERFVPQQ